MIKDKEFADTLTEFIGDLDFKINDKTKEYTPDEILDMIGDFHSGDN